MEIVEEVPVIKTIIHKYCDDCGVEIIGRLNCHKAVCNYCDKLLCEKCIKYETETGSDYRIVYCKSCSDIYMKHKSKIDELEKVYMTEIRSMQKECKDARVKNV